MIKKLKEWAKRIKQNLYAIYIAYTKHNKELPWYAKLLAIVVLAYALSPIDLIPDFIPILGYLDDIILLPIGIALVIKFIPENIFNKCKKEAIEKESKKLPKNYFAATVIVLIWLIVVLAIILAFVNR